VAVHAADAHPQLDRPCELFAPSARASWGAAPESRASELGVKVKPRVSEMESGRAKKYRLFFIGYVTAWFFAGVAIELVGALAG